MIQLTDHMKFKKMEDLSVDASVPLRRRYKIIVVCMPHKTPSKKS
jgi:hypothetical protein